MNELIRSLRDRPLWTGPFLPTVTAGLPRLLRMLESFEASRGP